MTNDWIKAGEIARETLEYGSSLVKKGASMREVCDACDEKIKKLGAIPAFPSQVSCNDIAAHYCPDLNDTSIFSDQLVSLDVGACFNGAIGDNAITIDLSNQYSDLIKASRDALNQALKIIQIGTSLGQIGRTIQETIQSYGFSPVRNLSGHGLGLYNIHDKPSIPNFDTGDNTELVKGMKIAIEPFASMGKGIIYESSPATVYSLVHKKPVRNPFSRSILQEIDTYKGLPFASRWLTKKFGEMKTQIALRDLTNLGIIKDHPPLIDMAHGFVSQAEHTVLVDDKIIITTQK
ncbi:MAG: type II methionyl aminopeptidase [Candidatus Woesearchaeota archaeon]